MKTLEAWMGLAGISVVAGGLGVLLLAVTAALVAAAGAVVGAVFGGVGAGSYIAFKLIVALAGL